jgi:hypothetical protein
MNRAAIIVFLLGVLIGVGLTLWLRPKTVKENFKSEEEDGIVLTASEKELFEDLKNDRLNDTQIDKLIKLGTITDSLMDKFMVKAMGDAKQKFTDLKSEDPLGKALTEVKKSTEEEPAPPKPSKSVKPLPQVNKDDEEEDKPVKVPPKVKKEEMTIEDAPESPSHIRVKSLKVEGFSGSRFEPPAYASCASRT